MDSAKPTRKIARQIILKKQKYFCGYKKRLYICVVDIDKRTAPVCRFKTKKNGNHN